MRPRSTHAKDNVFGAVVTNTSSLIWADTLIPALCGWIIDISLIPDPAHVAVQLQTAAPIIILMLRWSTGGQEGTGVKLISREIKKRDKKKALIKIKWIKLNKYNLFFFGSNVGELTVVHVALKKGGDQECVFVHEALLSFLGFTGDDVTYVSPPLSTAVVW